MHFIFWAENDVDIEDFSFSAALESMLFGMSPEIVCTGDSCPSLDFQVQYNMPVDAIVEKLTAFPKDVYYIKADTSTTAAIQLPEEIVNLSMDFTKLTGNMPQHFAAENPMPVIFSYPETYLQAEGTTVVEKFVYVNDEKKTKA